MVGSRESGNGGAEKRELHLVNDIGDPDDPNRKPRGLSAAETKARYEQIAIEKRERDK